MGRPTKRARKVRQRDEFDLRRLQLALVPPTATQGVHAWTLPKIFDARAEQMRGNFRQPARLAEAMRTDDALFAAYENRLAPTRALKVELEARASSAVARRVLGEAAALFGHEGIGIRPETISTLNGTLANHGVAVGVLRHSPRPDGSRVDVDLQAWPIEFVRWDPLLRCLVTQVERDDAATAEVEASERAAGVDVPIVHGNGRWVVFAKHELEPWKQDAALLPGALVWARHAYAARDWARGSTAHGNAKVVGELPEGIALADADGALTPEAREFLELLQALASVEAPAGIRPAGSKTEYLVNGSTAWQVWSELMLNAEKAAARIYLGTDGMLGSVGGAPGVDISALFGVATTKVQGDVAALERGILTGVIEPWAAINFGDSTLAPVRRYLLPDADEERVRDGFAKRLAAFHAAIREHKENGFALDAEFVAELAKQFGVPAPALPVEADRGPSVTLAPTDVARVVTVNEARASAGLGPLTLADGTPDPAGRLTVEAFAAKAAPAATPSSSAARIHAA